MIVRSGLEDDTKDHKKMGSQARIAALDRGATLMRGLTIFSALASWTVTWFWGEYCNMICQVSCNVSSASCTSHWHTATPNMLCVAFHSRAKWHRTVDRKRAISQSARGEAATIFICKPTSLSWGHPLLYWIIILWMETNTCKSCNCHNYEYQC